MSIQRYGAYGTQAEPEGEFVTYADYEANAARLGEALELSDAELARWIARAVMEETQRKHAEAALTAERERADRAEAERDALRADAAFALLCDLVDGLERCRECDAARVRVRYHKAAEYKRIRLAALEALSLIERGRTATAAAMLREAVGHAHRVTRAMRG